MVLKLEEPDSVTMETRPKLSKLLRGCDRDFSASFMVLSESRVQSTLAICDTWQPTASFPEEKGLVLPVLEPGNEARPPKSL